MPAIELHPHQKAALADLNGAFRAHRRVVLSLPTGTGKTLTAAIFAKTNYLDQSRSVVWIAHSKELLNQAFETFVEKLGVSPETIGRRYDGADDLDRKPDATLWLLNNLVTTGPRAPDFLVIDEAHHAAAETYTSWLSEFGAHRPGGPAVLGLTATPYRLHEGKVTPLLEFKFSKPRMAVFESIAFSRSFCELAQVGAVAPFHHVTLPTHLFFKMQMQNGDFTKESLKQLDTRQRNGIIVDAWQKNRDRYGKTLVFVGTKDHAKNLASAFGDDADFVISGPDRRGQNRRGQDRRDEAITRFRNGSVPVLVNVGIFKEGVDVPDIRTVILARPTASPGLFTQMVGRGSRVRADKKFFYLLDVHDQLGRYEGFLARVEVLADRDDRLLSLVTRRSEAAERVARLQSRSLTQDAEVIVDIASTPARTILREFAGWIVFENPNGSPSAVGALLTADEYQELERRQIDGRVPPAAANALSRTKGKTPTITKCVAALRDGLNGRLHLFADIDFKAEVSVLKRDAPVALGIETPKELRDARAAVKELDSWGRNCGVGEAELGGVKEDYLTSRSAFGGLLCLRGENGPYLRRVSVEALRVVREKLEAKEKRDLSFADAQELQEELLRFEPDFAPHATLLLKSISRAKRPGEFSWAPAD